MREIDDPHHSEDNRQTNADQSQERDTVHNLDDNNDCPGHGAKTDLSLRRTFKLGPSLTVSPQILHDSNVPRGEILREN
jgi:hypothetical protein